MPFTLPFWIALLGASEPAPDSPLALEWRAPESCPSPREVVGAVTRLVTDRGTKPLEVSVAITTEADGYEAEVRFGGGTRALRGSSCREVTEAVVVLLALAIDPDAQTSSSGLAPESGPPQAPAPTPTATPNRTAPRAPTPATHARVPRRTAARTDPVTKPWRLGGFAHLVGELGMLPGAALGASAGARASSSPGFVELAALGLLPRTETLASNPNQGGHMYFLGAALSGCWAPGNPEMLFGCLGFEAGRLTGIGFGADRETTGHAPWLAPTARAVLRLPLGGNTAFEASLGLAAPLLRPDFGIDGAGFVHAAAAISGRLALGLGFF
jgi:hypothetical protein